MAKTKSPDPMSLRLPPELAKELDAAAEETHLSRSDLARLSIERGLKVLLAQLRSSPPADAAAA